jgi:hypothetical protein
MTERERIQGELIELYDSFITSIDEYVPTSILNKIDILRAKLAALQDEPEEQGVKKRICPSCGKDNIFSVIQEHHKCRDCGIRFYTDMDGEPKSYATLDAQFQPQAGKEELRKEELLFNSLSDFVFKTFPDASSNDHLKKLKIEADEAMQDNRDSSEYADCLMAVYGAAAKAGFSFDELIRAGFEKLNINKTRKWKRLPDGTYQHI